MNDESLIIHECLIIAMVLVWGHLSSRPQPIPETTDNWRESEQLTQACDESGGEWHTCTLREMERTLVK